MKKAKFLVAVMLPALAGMLMTTQVAFAACKAENVKLRVNEHGLWLKPDGGARCLFTSDPSDFSAQLVIKLRTPGKYKLRDGQVHVRQAIAKEVDGTAIGCSSNLEFEESEYTNTAEDDIEITVLGEDSAFGEFICYEIVVDDIGMLDPRAEVEEQTGMSIHVAGELYKLIDAFELLNGSSLGDPLSSVSLGDFLESGYGMTEQEAYELIANYRKK